MCIVWPSAESLISAWQLKPNSRRGDSIELYSQNIFAEYILKSVMGKLDHQPPCFRKCCGFNSKPSWLTDPPRLTVNRSTCCYGHTVTQHQYHGQW